MSAANRLDSSQKWCSTFGREKPVMAMLHLGGGTAEEVKERALEEVKIFESEGIDGVIAENYFGDSSDVERVLDELCSRATSLRIGLNILRDTPKAFRIAMKYQVDFLQIDSVAGHLPYDKDEAYAESLAEWRSDFNGAVLGGVRFKYQPVLSGRAEREDLELGSRRCDAIVVTGKGTGEQTGAEKIERFRAVLGQRYPLVVGAGLTVDNVRDQLGIADAAIVGSYLKDTYTDTGRVDATHVRKFMEAVREVRSNVNSMEEPR
jgi:predicted TIM-barrel enzyme